MEWEWMEWNVPFREWKRMSVCLFVSRSINSMRIVQLPILGALPHVCLEHTASDSSDSKSTVSTSCACMSVFMSRWCMRVIRGETRLPRVLCSVPRTSPRWTEAVLCIYLLCTVCVVYGYLAVLVSRCLTLYTYLWSFLYLRYLRTVPAWHVYT